MHQGPAHYFIQRRQPLTESSSPREPAPSLEPALADDEITIPGLLSGVQAEPRAQAGMPAAFVEVLIRLARSHGGRMHLIDVARQLSITTGVTRPIDGIQNARQIRRAPARRPALHLGRDHPCAQATDRSERLGVTADDRRSPSAAGSSGISPGQGPKGHAALRQRSQIWAASARVNIDL